MCHHHVTACPAHPLIPAPPCFWPSCRSWPQQFRMMGSDKVKNSPGSYRGFCTRGCKQGLRPGEMFLFTLCHFGGVAILFCHPCTQIAIPEVLVPARGLKLSLKSDPSLPANVKIHQTSGFFPSLCFFFARSFLPLNLVSSCELCAQGAGGARPSTALPMLTHTLSCCCFLRSGISSLRDTK